MSFHFIEPPSLSGLSPDAGVAGGTFGVSGDWLRDVEFVSFVDQWNLRIDVPEWERYYNPAVPTMPGQTAEFTANFKPNGYHISGIVPDLLLSVDGQNALEKFPKFSVEVSNSVGQSQACCYELVKDTYTIHNNLTVYGPIQIHAEQNDTIDNFLVRGTNGAIKQRSMETIFSLEAGHSNSAFAAQVADIALSVQMNWTEFETQFVTKETISTNGDADSSQGLEIAALYIEPTKSDSYLLIDVDLCVTATELTDVACALFRGSESTPIKVWSQSISWPDQVHTLRLRHIDECDVAGEAQHYSIRVGVASPAFYNYRGQKVYINRTGGYGRQSADIFGTQAKSVMWIREMKHNPNVTDHGGGILT